MTDYVRAVYLNTRPSSERGIIPQQAKNIRDWTWEQSALIRWVHTEPSEIDRKLKSASLIVLDWSSRNANKAKSVCDDIRREYPSLPIIIFVSEPGRTPSRDRFLATTQQAAFVQSTIDVNQIRTAFQTLNLVLPTPRVRVHPDPRNLMITGLVEWLGVERLQLAIQKFFPDAENAYIMPVAGGWSDAKLCRLFVDTADSPYFLKIFTRRSEYMAELLRHSEAKSWLRNAIVDLMLIPEMGPEILDQTEAFPDTGPVYPVCYESASTRNKPRETLKKLYHDQSGAAVETAVARLLKVLAADQSGKTISKPPWSASDPHCFQLDSKTKMGIIAAVDDLSLYGPALSGEAQWDLNVAIIQDLLYGPLPLWLSEPWPVTVGHVHGDPNPRNCLVNPDDLDDLKLIDCGGYKPDGRLVSDLALLERDIKLILMGIEKEAGGFFDLDVRQLVDHWSHAERDSILRGLEYSLAFAPVSPRSVKMAYRLVGQIRERAKELSQLDDPEGKHYFAALLFWTLDILKYQAVRPTKKLLALHSSAEIIRKFR